MPWQCKQRPGSQPRRWPSPLQLQRLPRKQTSSRSAGASLQNATRSPQHLPEMCLAPASVEHSSFSSKEPCPACLVTGPGQAAEGEGEAEGLPSVTLPDVRGSGCAAGARRRSRQQSGPGHQQRLSLNGPPLASGLLGEMQGPRGQGPSAQLQHSLPHPAKAPASSCRVHQRLGRPGLQQPCRAACRGSGRRMRTGASAVASAERTNLAPAACSSTQSNRPAVLRHSLSLTLCGKSTLARPIVQGPPEQRFVPLRQQAVGETTLLLMHDLRQAGAEGPKSQNCSFPDSLIDHVRPASIVRAPGFLFELLLHLTQSRPGKKNALPLENDAVPATPKPGSTPSRAGPAPTPRRIAPTPITKQEANEVRPAQRLVLPTSQPAFLEN